MDYVRTRASKVLIGLAWVVLALPARGDDVLEPGSTVQRVVDSGKFTEGPAFDRHGDLYFSDGANDRIMKLTSDGKPSVFRQPCGRTNGMKFDAEGRLVMCQSSSSGGKRRVARLESDGTETPLAEKYEDQQLNAPNDLTIDRQGRIYFTDINPAPEKGGLPSSVYRVDGPGKFVRVIGNLKRPNGIVISADNKRIYVSDRGTQKLHKFIVKEDGALTADGCAYDFAPDRGIDGMCLDVDGNIYAAAGEKETTGLFVISPDGKLLLHKPMGEFSTNVAFGGKDMRDLYLTATTSVFKLRTVKAGLKLVGQGGAKD